MSAEHESCRPGLWISVETDHSLYFPAHSYPVRQMETCPRGKPACSKAKLNEYFSCQPVFSAGRCLRPTWRQSLGDRYPSKTMFRFPLTTLKLSRRIARWTSGGPLLKLQRPL